MKTHARATFTSAVVLAAVFFAGALVGRAWDRDAEAADVAVRDSVSGETTDREQRRTPMYEQVGLSDAQRVVIDSIVVHYRSDVRELQRSSREAYEREYMVRVEAVREAIKEVMTPAQRAAYDSLLTASDRRREERRQERETEEGASGGEG